jgi:hypothetical protein
LPKSGGFSRPPIEPLFIWEKSPIAAISSASTWICGPERAVTAFAAEITLKANRFFRLTVQSSKKLFSTESDNISRDEKCAFQTPKVYCVDCGSKQEVQVFAAIA